MKRIFMLTLLVMCAGMMLFAFAACSDEETPEEVTIVGEWENKDFSETYYTFKKDGTGSYTFVGNEMPFTYEDDGETVTIRYETATEANVFKYEIKGKTLKIEDSFGEMVTYTKK